MVLTQKRDIPFILCFKYPLEKGYTLNELSQQNIKDFQRFLDKVSHMTVQQVDELYSRRPDKTDSYNGQQVYHYGIKDDFRIHVVCEEARYKMIRIDPNHKYHN